MEEIKRFFKKLISALALMFIMGGCVAIIFAGLHSLNNQKGRYIIKEGCLYKVEYALNTGGHMYEKNFLKTCDPEKFSDYNN